MFGVIMAEEEVKEEPAFSIFLSNDTFGYETSMTPEESIFWLDVVKTSILNKVIGGDEDE
jgi:hypothetical protein